MIRGFVCLFVSDSIDGGHWGALQLEAIVFLEMPQHQQQQQQQQVLSFKVL